MVLLFLVYVCELLFHRVHVEGKGQLPRVCPRSSGLVAPTFTHWTISPALIFLLATLGWPVTGFNCWALQSVCCLGHTVCRGRLEHCTTFPAICLFRQSLAAAQALQFSFLTIPTVNVTVGCQQNWLYNFCFWDRVSCNPGWPETHCIALNFRCSSFYLWNVGITTPDILQCLSSNPSWKLSQ